jgi:hypothetical protein
LGTVDKRSRIRFDVGELTVGTPEDHHFWELDAWTRGSPNNLVEQMRRCIYDSNEFEKGGRLKTICEANAIGFTLVILALLSGCSLVPVDRVDCSERTQEARKIFFDRSVLDKTRISVLEELIRDCGNDAWKKAVMK